MNTTFHNSGKQVRTLILGLILFVFTSSVFSQLSYPVTLNNESKGFEMILENVREKVFGKTFVVRISEQFNNDMVFEKDMRLEAWMMEEDSWIYNKNTFNMEFEHVEEQLALEAWMMQVFKLEDRILEEDLDLEEWMIADTDWVGLN